MIKHNLISILKDVDRYSCPNLINFHCHTTCSDGALTPEDLIEQAINLNFQHLAVTDHHSLDAIPRIHKWLDDNNLKSNSITFWTGIEISCILKGCVVHIIGLGFDIPSESLNSYINGEACYGNDLQAKHVINAIHCANGISILAHPGRYRLDYRVLIEEAYKLGIKGIEVWYDYQLSSSWEPSSIICESIDSICDSFDLLKSCGTDTHGYSLLGR